MVEGMKLVSEQSAEMTATMADLMRQIAEATTQMRNSTKQNAEATRRMVQLAELARKQSIQNDRQAQALSDLAYDSKRDSEVMKAITVVTLIFLPATFVSVRPDPVPEIPAHLLSRQSSAWVSSLLIKTCSSSPRKGGFISFALFRSPSSSLGGHLGGYGGQARKWRSLLITLLVKSLQTPPLRWVLGL